MRSNPAMLTALKFPVKRSNTSEELPSTKLIMVVAAEESPTTYPEKSRLFPSPENVTVASPETLPLPYEQA